MTPEEALKIEAEIRAQRYDPRHYTTEFAAQQACMALADALREAQAAVVQMREDAMKKRRIERLLPDRPAARTYDDGVRDAAKIAHKAADGLRGRDCCTPERRFAREIEALLSPAPAVAPVAQKHDPDKGCRDCENFRDATSDAERHCGAASITLMFCDPDDYPAPSWCPKRAPVAAPKPVAFDAEKALNELRRAMIDRYPRADTLVNSGSFTAALNAALAAGRGAR